MAKRNVIEMHLPTADDLFSTQEERDNEKREYVKAISLDKISDFPDHPFKCILRSLADSDAFQSGRCAEHNGRPETLAIIN